VKLDYFFPIWHSMFKKWQLIDFSLLYTEVGKFGHPLGFFVLHD
jgi:hypothetical protein